MKTKKLVALLLVTAMLFTFVFAVAACDQRSECVKNGHKLTAVAGKEATTEEAGYEAYWKCSVCNKIFSDEAGKHELSKPLEIPKAEKLGDVNPVSITASPSVVMLEVGEQSAKPTLKIVPSNAIATVSWTSENNAVATVNNEGVITAVASGKTTITVTSTVASSVKAEVYVTVNAPAQGQHICKHVCPTCGKCTDSTCTDPVCADKCQGHQTEDPDKGKTKDNPLTPEEAIALMDEAGSGNVVDPTNKEGYYIQGVVNTGSTINSYSEWSFTLGTGSKVVTCQAKVDGSVTNKPASTNGALDGETVIIKGFLELYSGKYQCAYLPANVSPTGAKFTPSIVDIAVQELPPVEVESVSFNTKKDTLYLLPLEGNYIELTATVQPSNAPQDIVWTIDGEDKVTFASGSYLTNKFGRVTYKGQEGTITLTATAKDTDKSASVTIIIQDRKGTKQDDALTVDEAIALVADTDQAVFADDSNEKKGGFYITGTVATGSRRVGNGWEFSLLGSNDKTLACSVTDAQLEKDGITIPLKTNGELDDSQITFYAVGLRNSDGVYSANEFISKNTIKSLQLPALTAIEIEAASTEVTVPYSVEITVKSITPANAVFENVEWITSDETKATVSGDTTKATVTTIAVGEVKISVRYASIVSNEITLTILEEQKAVKAIYDWTSALEGKVCDSTLYSQRDPREMITEINQWTPGQQEIKSFVTEGTMYDSIEAPGIAYVPAKRLLAGQITIQTLHEIKKVTIKVVPFADATTTQLSVNTISKTHEKGDSVYTGDPSSAIDIVFELTEATTTLNVEATGVAGNSFAIVGIKLEW